MEFHASRPLFGAGYTPLFTLFSLRRFGYASAFLSRLASGADELLLSMVDEVGKKKKKKRKEDRERSSSLRVDTSSSFVGLPEYVF